MLSLCKSHGGQTVPTLWFFRRALLGAGYSGLRSGAVRLGWVSVFSTATNLPL